MHALETLLVSHADAAFDKFQAWALRNTFDVQDGLEIVIVSRFAQAAGSIKF